MVEILQGRTTVAEASRSSDNDLVFMSRRYTALVRSCGLYRFQTLQQATRVIGDWISFDKHRRPHQALNMKTSAEAFALAA